MLTQEGSGAALELAGAGQTDEFAAVARRETPRLLAVAHSVLDDAGAAEDAVQDTLLLAWRSWASLRDPARRQAWLVRICVRRCLRVRRTLLLRARREDGGSGLVDAGLAVPATDLDGGPIDWATAYRRLSPAQRAVVTLHYHHGYSLDECAEALGRRPGTARRHLARALDKLREEARR